MSYRQRSERQTLSSVGLSYLSCWEFQAVLRAGWASALSNKTLPPFFFLFSLSASSTLVNFCPNFLFVSDMQFYHLWCCDSFFPNKNSLLLLVLVLAIQNELRTQGHNHGNSCMRALCMVDPIQAAGLYCQTWQLPCWGSQKSLWGKKCKEISGSRQEAGPKGEDRKSNRITREQIQRRFQTRGKTSEESGLSSGQKNRGVLLVCILTCARF